MEYFNRLGNVITNDVTCTREIKYRVAISKAAFKKKKNFSPANCGSIAFVRMKLGQYEKQIRNNTKLLKCNAGEGWRRSVRFENKLRSVGINEILGRVRVKIFAMEKQCITHSECVFLALVIQRAMSIDRIVLPMTSPAVPYFSTLSQKRRDFRKKVGEKMCINKIQRYTHTHTHTES